MNSRYLRTPTTLVNNVLNIFAIECLKNDSKVSKLDFTKVS